MLWCFWFDNIWVGNPDCHSLWAARHQPALCPQTTRRTWQGLVCCLGGYWAVLHNQVVIATSSRLRWRPQYPPVFAETPRNNIFSAQLWNVHVIFHLSFVTIVMSYPKRVVYSLKPDISSCTSFSGWKWYDPLWEENLIKFCVSKMKDDHLHIMHSEWQAPPPQRPPPPPFP